jgi:ribosomal protein RSM22 (predicted rRNA methylase)
MPKVGDVDGSGALYTLDRVDRIGRQVLELKDHEFFRDFDATSPLDKSTLAELERYLQSCVDVAGQRSELEAGEQSELELSNDPEVSDQTELGPSEQESQEIAVDSRSPVQVIRDSGASVENVVREARQFHQDHLPDGVLSEEEFQTYMRLYGEPEAEQAVEEASLPGTTDEKKQHELLDQNGDGLSYRHTTAVEDQDDLQSTTKSDRNGITEGKTDEQRAAEVAEYIGGEIQSYEEEEDTLETDADRGHPLTIAGRFQTSPRTVFLPKQSFINPVQKILSEYSNKHIDQTAERLFGGEGLPDSTLTPRSGRSHPQKPIPLNAAQQLMGMMEANAYISVLWPSTYAAVTAVLTETRKRLGSQWLRDLFAQKGGPSVLDAGGGGVGVLAWRDIVTAEWKAMHSSDASPPPAPLGRSTVLSGAKTLRSHAASLLENTTFLPRLPDYVHIRDGPTMSDDRPASQRKQFDVIIAPHTLWCLQEDWQRKHQVQNLWSLLNPNGGVLLLVEKGVPRGFEVIAGARELLRSQHIISVESPGPQSPAEAPIDDSQQVRKVKGMIIAPCTNHSPCPMYTIPGVSRGRKNYCSFQQRYIRPHFLQRILGATATGRSHDDVDFAYISVRKGRDLQDTSTAGEKVLQGATATGAAFEGHEEASLPEETALVNSLALPRIVLPPLKRPGHVTIDLCTPAGKIDRWTIPKSFSKTAYRDARKANWGDLWALGAKTSVPRLLNLGGQDSKRSKNTNERIKSQADDIIEEMEGESENQRAFAGEVRQNLMQGDDGIPDEHFDADAAAMLDQMQAQPGHQKKKNPPSALLRPQKQQQQHQQHQRAENPNDSADGRTNQRRPTRHRPTQTVGPGSNSFLDLQEAALLQDMASERRQDERLSRGSQRSSSSVLRSRQGQGQSQDSHVRMQSRPQDRPTDHRRARASSSLPEDSSDSTTQRASRAIARIRASRRQRDDGEGGDESEVKDAWQQRQEIRQVRKKERDAGKKERERERAEKRKARDDRRGGPGNRARRGGLGGLPPDVDAEDRGSSGFL